MWTTELLVSNSWFRLPVFRLFADSLDISAIISRVFESLGRGGRGWEPEKLHCFFFLMSFQLASEDLQKE